MPNAVSMLSYTDIKEVLDRALETPAGLSVTFQRKGEAIRWVSRANSFRLLDRKSNAKIYPEPTHTYHNASVYDTLAITRTEGVVQIKVRAASSLKIEELKTHTDPTNT